jgi:hypothetical protein
LNGATTTGRGQNFTAEHICWNALIAPSTSSQSPSCAPSSSCIRFAPTLNRSRSPLITNPRKFFTASDAGFSTDEIIATTSPPIAFFSECSSMHPIPSPTSTSDAPGFDFTTPLLRLKSATRACPGCSGIGSHAPVVGL